MVQTAAWSTTYRVPDTLPSDTEESIVGTQWHQEASSQLADMLRDVANRRGASWEVCAWITLIGLQHENGTDYDPKPDVMVLRQPLASGSLASVRLDQVGAPLLVVEVASDSTKANDQGDKRAAYAAVGVPEYVVFDPDGTLLARPLIAWRLKAAGYVPWEPEADGWWHSRVLDVSFQPGQPYLRVRDRDGVILEPSGAVRRQVRMLEQQLAEAERTRGELEEMVQRLREERGRPDTP